jgi:hypothetical protein
VLEVNISASELRPASARQVSIAVPLDRTMDYLKGRFTGIQILTSSQEATGLSGSAGWTEAAGSRESTRPTGRPGDTCASVLEGFTCQAGATGQQGDTGVQGTIDATVPVEVASEHLHQKSTDKELVYSQDQHCVPCVESDVKLTDKEQVYRRSQHGVTCVESDVKLTDKELVYSRDQIPTVLQLPTEKLHSVEKTEKVSKVMSAIHSLPYELYEILLMSTARLLAKTLLTTDLRPDVKTFVTLAAVCRHFHIILIKRKWFSTTLRQYLRVMCHPFRMCPSLLLTYNGCGHRVQGLTKLNRRLYVIYWESDMIRVYMSEPSVTELPSIHINGLKYPTSIAACSINSCLYVADLDSCVWRLRADGKIDKWLETNVMSVSVTSDGRVVILTYVEGPDSSEVWHGGVVIYNQQRIKLTSLQFPHSSIVCPWHAIQTVSKTFMVCLGLTNTELNQVCEVNNKGAIVKSYGNSPGHNKGHFNTPEHIAMACDERVLVADYHNRRVLLLDKHLKIQRVLLSWPSDCPTRLYYDEHTKELIVGLRSGQFDIFSF